MAQYGKGEYWDDRYSRDPEPFDWYQRWAGLKDIFTQTVKPTHKILNVGAGNSRLSEEMYDDGFQNIMNIDISSTVVNAMKEKYTDRPTMRYEVQDIRSMDGLNDGAFDVVIDKGTMDSVLCGEGSTHNCQKVSFLKIMFNFLGFNAFAIDLNICINQYHVHPPYVLLQIVV